MSAYNVSALRDPATPVARRFDPSALLVAAFDALYAWRERYRGRNALAELDPRMLKDIGLTPTDVLNEVEKPFWTR